MCSGVVHRRVHRATARPEESYHRVVKSCTPLFSQGAHQPSYWLYLCSSSSRRLMATSSPLPQPHQHQPQLHMQQLHAAALARRKKNILYSRFYYRVKACTGIKTLFPIDIWTFKGAAGPHPEDSGPRWTISRGLWSRLDHFQGHGVQAGPFPASCGLAWTISSEMRSKLDRSQRPIALIGPFPKACDLDWTISRGLLYVLNRFQRPAVLAGPFPEGSGPG